MQEQVKCKHCDMMIKNSPKGIGSHMGHYHKDIIALNKKVVKFTILCLECNELVANSNNILGQHVKKKHGLRYFEYLVKYEHNGKHPTCECGCGLEVKWHLGGFSRFANKTCSSKGENNGMFGKKGNDSPNFGKKRTLRMKENYSKAAKKRWEDPNDKRYEIMKSDEYRQKQSVAQIASYEKNPEQNQKRINSLKKWWQDNPEMRIEKRKLAFQLLEEGKIGPQAPFKTEWVFNPFTQQNEYMHSSWETAFLQKCIQLNLPVTKKHDIIIPYVDPLDGKEKNYIPDFLDLSDLIIYEIKGKFDEVVFAKSEAAREWCNQNGYVYALIDEKIT